MREGFLRERAGKLPTNTLIAKLVGKNTPMGWCRAGQGGSSAQAGPFRARSAPRARSGGPGPGSAGAVRAPGVPSL